MRDVFLIEDLETLRAVAEPTRIGILELLTEPRSVTQLAEALDVPRTRLYHHVELLAATGLIEVVEERRVGALTERVYAPTAKTYRPSLALLTEGDDVQRADALATLFFDAPSADLRRSLRAGVAALDATEGRRRVGLGRSTGHVTPERAAEFIAELDALLARFDDAHAVDDETCPYAFVWAFYPASRTIE